MPQLSLYLFGPPRFEVAGTPIEVKRRKALALLVYLAVDRNPVSRDTLATLFWPEADQRKARTTLRSALSSLNQSPIGDWLVLDHDLVSLSAEAHLWVDVAAFGDQLTICRTHEHLPEAVCPDCLPHLVAAVELYQADFLAGFTLPDAPMFDEWQFFQAEHLRGDLISALDRLVQAYIDQADPEAAIAHARRRLALDPLHELTHCRLMELYALTDQPMAAQRQYHICLQTLEAELGMPPSEATTKLYHNIRAGKYHHAPNDQQRPINPAINQADPLSPVPFDPVVALENNPFRQTSREIRHNLPAQTSPFIGRETELTTLNSLLRQADRRLVTIVGAGGMGKTRLALAAAQAQLESDRFPDGVYFVSLSPLSEVPHMVPAIAEALGILLDTGGSGSQASLTQILTYLRSKQLLLVLDNFEHLLAGVELVAHILKSAPQVAVLATSRERLHLHEEQLFLIQGLAFPDQETTAHVDHYTAVQLFIQTARRIQPDFELDAPAAVYLTRICRLVEGMPLGLELAAGWIDSLPLVDIAAEIQRSLDFLETEDRNVPARQRSMRAVFDSAWERLSISEQRILADFSVFRGGFTRQAAQAVTGVSLRLLNSLVNKSLVHFHQAAARYHIHELLRQYAADQLAASGRTQTARDAHAVYFARFLQDKFVDLKSRYENRARAEIGADFENIRRAWLWAVERRDYSTLDQALEGLYWFLRFDFGRYQAGQDLFHFAREKLTPTDHEAPHPVWGKILARILPYGTGIERPAQAKVWLEEALTLAVARGDQTEQAFCHWILGQIFANMGDALSAMAEFETSLPYYRQVDDRFYMAWILKDLGEIYKRLHQYRRSIDISQQSLLLFRELEITEYPVLSSMAYSFKVLGEYQQSVAYLSRGYQISQDRGNHGDMAGALTYLGVGFYEQGEFEKARTVWVEALRIAEEKNLDYRQIMALLFLGKMACIQGEFEPALRYLTRLQNRNSINPGLKSQAEIWLGLTVYGLGQYDLARQHLLEGLRGPTDWALDSLPLAALLFNQAGEAERAVMLQACAFGLEHRTGHFDNQTRIWANDYPPFLQLKDELGSTQPPDLYQTAWQKGQTLDLATTMADLIETLSKPGWPARIGIADDKHNPLSIIS